MPASLAEEVLCVMRHPDFAEIFSPYALAEAPLIGEVGGTRYAGQVDRLLVTDDTVLVVDFKTGKKPENNVIQTETGKMRNAETPPRIRQ
jgi:ATP-dependent helicase/nuclease subunit A